MDDSSSKVRSGGPQKRGRDANPKRTPRKGDKKEQTRTEQDERTNADKSDPDVSDRDDEEEGEEPKSLLRSHQQQGGKGADPVKADSGREGNSGKAVPVEKKTSGKNSGGKAKRGVRTRPSERTVDKPTDGFFNEESVEPGSGGQKVKKSAKVKMADRKRGPDKRPKRVPNIRYAIFEVSFTTDEWERSVHGSYIKLDKSCIVSWLHDSAEFCKKCLIIGDHIRKVNSYETKTLDPQDVMRELHEKKVELEVARRFGASPITPHRAKAIRLQRTEGFSYCIVKVKRSSDEPQRPLGIRGLAKHKNKIYIKEIDPDSVASCVLAVGDGLLDLDGVPVPFLTDSKWVARYEEMFQKNGSFTVVVERPISSEAFHYVTAIYNALCPVYQEPKMADDAVQIGRLAAQRHKQTWQGNKKQPAAILRAPPAARSPGATSGPHIDGFEQSESQIGTSVPEAQIKQLVKLAPRYSIVEQVGNGGGKTRRSKMYTLISDLF